MSDGPDGEGRGANHLPSDDPGRSDPQNAVSVAAEVLALVESGSDRLRSKLRQIEDHQQRLGELEEARARRLEVLREQVFVAEVRAEEQEEAAREAEEWLRRVHDEIVRRFTTD